MAGEAGLMLGRFHKALLDFNYEYQSKRRHAGDYRFHMENLQKALSAHPEHEYYSRTAPLAHQMLKEMTALIADLSTTPRNVHGDPKISNIIFDEHDQAVCLVDFDTLGRSGWSLEIADALRSWCNPHKEDDPMSHVDLSIAEAALSGYGQIMKGLISAKEIEELIVHTQCITLCLAIRYLYDVLNECYWAYDQSRFKRPAEHNWLRAQAMYKLFQDFAQQNAKLRELAQCMLSNDR
jgi:Ser/Thr protein kinase RdoA (MazF antagonist)